MTATEWCLVASVAVYTACAATYLRLARQLRKEVAKQRGGRATVVITAGPHGCDRHVGQREWVCKGCAVDFGWRFTPEDSKPEFVGQA